MGFNCLLPICLDDSTRLEGKDLAKYLIYIIDKYDFENLDIVLTTELFVDTLQIEGLTLEKANIQAKIIENEWREKSEFVINGLKVRLGSNRKINVLTWAEFENKEEFSSLFNQIDVLSKDSQIITKANAKTYSYKSCYQDTIGKKVSSYCSKLTEVLKNKGHINFNLSEEQINVIKKYSESYLKREATVQLLWANKNYNYQYLFHHHKLNPFMQIIHEEQISKKDSYRFVQLPLKTVNKYYNKKSKTYQSPNSTHETALNPGETHDDMDMLAYIVKLHKLPQHKAVSLPPSVENSDGESNNNSPIGSLNTPSSFENGNAILDAWFKRAFEEVKRIKTAEDMEKLAQFTAKVTANLQHYLEDSKKVEQPNVKNSPITNFFNNKEQETISSSFKKTLHNDKNYLVKDVINHDDPNAQYKLRISY